MASLSSDELNYMIFRYLNESNFRHSAFTFGYEARMNNSPIDGNLVPPQALIKLVQKGMQYIEMEAMTVNDDGGVNEYISLISPLELIKYNADELWKIVNERKKNRETTAGVKGSGGEASTCVEDKGKGKLTQPQDSVKIDGKGSGGGASTHVEDKGKAKQTQPGNVKTGGKGSGGGANTRVEDQSKWEWKQKQPRDGFRRPRDHNK